MRKLQMIMMAAISAASSGVAFATKNAEEGNATAKQAPSSSPQHTKAAPESEYKRAKKRIKAAIEPNFPPGKTPGIEKFADQYFNLSKGGDVRGPWNQGDQWQFIDDTDMEKSAGGDGSASVRLGKDEEALFKKMAKRTASKTAGDPTTGADIGAGPGAGSTKGDIK